MALMIWLKPGEQLMLNGAMIENPGDGKIRIQLNNQVRMLRQRDYLAPSDDHSPAERVYYQAMLLSGGAPEASIVALNESITLYRATYGSASKKTPKTEAALHSIIALASDGQSYLAMVEARTLIAIENPTHPVLPQNADR